MNAVCFVLARSESIRLPRKNFLDLDGKPMLLSVLDKLVEAKIGKLVVVLSTYSDSGLMNVFGLPHAKHDEKSENPMSEKDLDRISQFRAGHNETVIDDKYSDVDVLVRPQSLAGPDVKPEEIILHYLPQYPNADMICLAQCTSPLVDVKEYREMAKCFEFDDSDLLFTVNPMGKCNGAMYIIKRRVLEKNQSFWSVDINPTTHMLGFSASIDVDTIEDFLVARSILKAQAHFNGKL